MTSTRNLGPATKAGFLGLALSGIALIAFGGTGATSEERPASAALIPIPNAKIVGGSVLVGGQPTREDLESAAAAGYRTIVNLRSPGELEGWDEREVAESSGLRYVSIPIRGAEGLTRENAERLAKELDAADNHPIMLHCSSGNRVGALLALEAFYVDRLGPVEALQLGLDSGLTSLEAAVVEHLRRNGTEE